MQPRSQFVFLVLFALGVKDVSEVTPEKINQDVLFVLKEEMTTEAARIFVSLCKLADQNKEQMYFASTDPRWKSAGFGAMNEDARAIFRRIQMHYGRELCFSKDGMIVFPHQNALHANG